MNVLFLMKKSVYMLECEIGLDDVVLDEELLDYSVLTVDGKHGIIKEIFWILKPIKCFLKMEF